MFSKAFVMLLNLATQFFEIKNARKNLIFNMFVLFGWCKFCCAVLLFHSAAVLDVSVTHIFLCCCNWLELPF